MQKKGSKQSKPAVKTAIAGKSTALASKTPEEIKEVGVNALNALALGGTSVGCWFKDSSGGPDQCVPMPSEDACTAAGGSPTAGGCPNTFAFIAGHVADLKNQVDRLHRRVELLAMKKKKKSK